MIVFLFHHHPEISKVFRDSSCYCCGVDKLDLLSDDLFGWIASKCDHANGVRHAYKLLQLAVDTFPGLF